MAWCKTKLAEDINFIVPRGCVDFSGGDAAIDSSDC